MNTETNIPELTKRCSELAAGLDHLVHNKNTQGKSFANGLEELIRCAVAENSDLAKDATIAEQAEEIKQLREQLIGLQKINESILRNR